MTGEVLREHPVRAGNKDIRMCRHTPAAATGKDKEFYPAYRSPLLYINCRDYDRDRRCIIYKFKE